MPTNRFGWKPSPYDGRDYIFTHSQRVLRDQRTVVLEHPFPARNQNEVPCCVSCAVTVCMEILDARNPPQTELSPLYHYFVTRPRSDQLVDLTIREGLASAAARGISATAHHNPLFSRAGALQPPGDSARSDALRHRLVAISPVPTNPPTFRPEYYLLPNTNRVAGWTAALTREMPIIMGFWLTAGYDALSFTNNVLNGQSLATSERGHAVVILGFDDDRERFLVKDSRGAEKGVEGHWWLPYQLADTHLVAEAWAVGKITY